MARKKNGTVLTKEGLAAVAKRSDTKIEEYGTREEWLAARATGIGASEAAVILGLSRWSSPLELWALKCDLAEPKPATRRMEIGSKAEGLVAELYGEERCVKLTDPGDFTLFRSGKKPHLFCTPDRLQVMNGQVEGAELKTVDPRWSAEWDDAPPPAYFAQCQHSMLVTGFERWTLVGLIGFQEVRWFDIERDEKFIARMAAAHDAFWDRVTGREQPPPGTTEADAAILAKLFPEPEPGSTLAFDAEVAEWDEQRTSAMVAIESAGQVKQEAENAIKAALGNMERGVLPDGAGYTWKRERTRKAAVKVDHSQAEALAKAGIEHEVTPESFTRKLRRQKAKGV